MQEIQGLLNELKNGDWWSRKNTIERLLVYPEGLYISVLEEWLKRGDDALLRNAAMEAYRALGRRSLGSLISMFREDDEDVRVFAANVLGDIGDAEALPAVVEALGDVDDNVRMAAAEALGKMKDDRSIHALAELLEDVPWVALAAIESIGRIGGDDALSVLHGCLEKEDYRGMACTALEKAGNQDSIQYLAPYVRGEGDLRDLILKAIITIAEREGIQLQPSYFDEMATLLVDLQRSPQDDIKRAAFIALSWSEDMCGLPFFLDAVNDDKLQEYAVKGLISLGERAVPDMINALDKPGTNRVIFAKVLSMSGANSKLLAFASDDDPEVRVEAALAAGLLDSDEAFEVLLKLERDPVEEVREAARVSLKNHGRMSDNL